MRESEAVLLFSTLALSFAVSVLPCLTSQGEGVARSRRRPFHVIAHDARSFHPGQVSVALLVVWHVLLAPRMPGTRSREDHIFLASSFVSFYPALT